MKLFYPFKFVVCLLIFPFILFGQCPGDVINPIANCNNPTVFLDASGLINVDPVSIDNMSTDNCGIETMLINGGATFSFNCSNIGVNNATLTVIDSAGNNAFCNATVTVLDTSAAVAICQHQTVYLDASGQAVVWPSSIDAGSYDACSIVDLHLDGLDSLVYTTADTGWQSVVLTAIDLSGNVDSCQALIQVLDTVGHCANDTVAPVAICQSLPILLSLDNTGQAVVVPSMLDVGSYDNCGIDSMLVNGQNSYVYDCASLGVPQNVVLTAVDQAGLTNSCVATLYVTDTIPPVAICQNTQVYLDASGFATVLPSDVDAGSVDNCVVNNSTINGSNTIIYTLSDVGVHNVVLTVSDFAFNLSNCIASVQVLDTFSRCILSGTIFNDSNYNCNKDSAEQELQNIVVVAQGASTYYGTTDAQGNYTLQVVDGAYAVHAVMPAPYWIACPDTHQVYAAAGAMVDTLDFALQAIGSCSYMQVDIAAPFLRKTTATYYDVSYCNHGTAVALNASVDVEIDSSLTVLGSSIPFASQNGHVYTFNLGNLAVNQCGSFRIDVIVQQSAVNGQTHCSEARIQPDSLCLSPWNGANLQVDVVCDVDTVRFTIHNQGLSNVLNKSFTIIEDHVIMMVGNTGAINAGASVQIAIPAISEKTYRLMVDQDASFPAVLGSPVATAAIEGCVANSQGGFNTGFITQFNNGNSSPFVAVDCQQNIFAFDPNDKAAQPEGYDANFHYIDRHTVLDYRIRFQNTGTDTAIHVVLRDTLSEYLNIESIRMGASSHDYAWRLLDQGLLEITFNNIMLPDSNVNEPLSHGFINFEIEQKEGNPLGTVIYNQAQIYFDANAPIYTNTTFHTLDENYMLVMLNVDERIQEMLELNVYPNPFTQYTTIELQGAQYDNIVLKLMDISGREIPTEYTVDANKIHLERGQLSTGVYFVQLHASNQIIATGKLIVR